MASIVRTRIRADASTIALRVVSYVVITLFSAACLLPFIIVVSSSITSEASIMKYGFPIIPRNVTLFAYKVVFEYPDIVIGSYAVTIGLTVVGTGIGLFLTAMGGYALQRPDFAQRNRISFYVYFTTLFSGGVVPFYIMMIRYFGLRDNYLAVLLPALMSPWLVILMKNFTKSIPHSITESAKIDGAGDFLIFIRLILPMSKPALATVGLFTALGYWNEWYNALLFLSPNMRYRPLQLFLYTVITRADFIRNSAAAANIMPRDVPSETMKMATAVVATGPVILFYPFVQRYFIKGITIGAVKG
jgi:putative aldouronate transport system permease protein